MLKYAVVSVLLVVAFAAHGVISGTTVDLIEDVNRTEMQLEVDNGNVTTFASKSCSLSYNCFKGRYYYFESVIKRTRDDAARFCTAIDMELVSVEDCAENAFISDTIKKFNCYKNYFWTSGFHNGNGMWKWGTGERFNYTNWMINEPNYRKNEHCVEYYYDFVQWNDQVCDKKRLFICESDIPCDE